MPSPVLSALQMLIHVTDEAGETVSPLLMEKKLRDLGDKKQQRKYSSVLCSASLVLPLGSHLCLLIRAFGIDSSSTSDLVKAVCLCVCVYARACVHEGVCV